MGILDDLTRMIPEKEVIDESNIKFDLEYNEEDGTYSVLNKGNKCCLVEFVDSKTDRTVEIDDAQLEPEYHIAYLSQITENEDVVEFEKKLDDIGFDNISKEEIDEDDLNETSNMDVINKFVDNSFPHNSEEAKEMGIDRWSPVWGSTNLKISKQDNGWALINYATPILFRDSEGNLYFNTTKYSVTTSKVQNQVKDDLSDKDVEYEEVDEEGIKNVIK